MTETPEGKVRSPSKTTRWLQLVLVGVGLAALVFGGRQLGGYLPQFAAWVEELGFWGPVAFAGGYALATVAFIPGSILTLAAGAIFGVAQGTLTVFLGATTGAILAFLIARYLARNAIERRIAGNAKFAAIDRAVGREGLKIVTLLRLAPIFPFNLLNYSLGLTKVRLLDYSLASFGMVPGTLLYVYYGAALGSLAAVAGGAEVERGWGHWVTLGLGLAAALAVTIVVARIARRALREEVGDA